jgi:hypothetical protein
MAVIGESDGYNGRVGRFHVFTRLSAPRQVGAEAASASGERWSLSQSIRPPNERINLYGEGVVFAGTDFVVFGGAHLAADGRSG